MTMPFDKEKKNIDTYTLTTGTPTIPFAVARTHFY